MGAKSSALMGGAYHGPGIPLAGFSARSAGNGKARARVQKLITHLTHHGPLKWLGTQWMLPLNVVQAFLRAALTHLHASGCASGFGVKGSRVQDFGIDGFDCLWACQSAWVWLYISSKCCPDVVGGNLGVSPGGTQLSMHSTTQEKFGSKKKGAE